MYILMKIIIYKRLWQYWLVINVCYKNHFIGEMDNPISYIYILMEIIIYKRLWQYWLVINVGYKKNYYI